MLSLFNRPAAPADLLSSKLYDQDSFYPAFLKDLAKCHSEVIIECPFITNRRLKTLLPILEKLKARKVRIAINTRDPRTHDEGYRQSDAHEAYPSCNIWAFRFYTPAIIIGKSPFLTEAYSTKGRSTSCRKTTVVR